ncbi:MAG: gamma-glutamylcyclotransferase family protein, partial [Pseudomonadota bacterium]
MRQAFGYGSLVNRGTHPFDCAHRTLQGWRRVWVGTAVRPAAFLSVEPAEGEIDGLMIDVPDAAWPDLDRREAHYDRVSLEDGG